MSYFTSYCRVKWTLEGFSRDYVQNVRLGCKYLISPLFETESLEEILKWHLQIDTAPDYILESTNDFCAELDELCETLDFDESSDLARLELSLDTLSNVESLVKYKFYFITSDQEEVLQSYGCAYKSRFLNGFGCRLDMNHIFNDKFIIDGLLTIVALIEVHDIIEEIPREMPYKHLFNSSCYSDFKIICNNLEIPTHQAVLYQNSPVFAAMFEAEMSEVQKEEINITDIDGKVIKEMLRFMYIGKIENIHEIAKDLLYAAEKYELDELKKKCIDSLSLHVNMNNVFHFLTLADRYKCDILLRNCIGLIKLQYKKLMFSRSQWFNPSDFFDSDTMLKTIALVLEEPILKYNFNSVCI